MFSLSSRPLCGRVRASLYATTLQQPSRGLSSLGNGSNPKQQFDVLIVGGGAGGISLASSLLRRKRDLNLAIVDPAQQHYYQPGWTMVGAGIFSPEETARPLPSLVPDGVELLRREVVGFSPKDDTVQLDDGSSVSYKRLVVCPGLKLAWEKVQGLVETLGKNGVTSNYRYDLAPYTWELVQGLKKGRAIFTQPPMPIKCAGAPQKALYLSADYWLKQGRLPDIQIDFNNAAGVLFGVADYVPALNEAMDKYSARRNFFHNLSEVDGVNKKAYFSVQSAPEADVERVEVDFDMLHVVPPQTSPDFVASSPLADSSSGFLDVDPSTLRHKTFTNIWGVGDVLNTPNAKTAAAVRKQVPTVANNIIEDLGSGSGQQYQYEGYGSCPLTVEKGKIVLAEFGYGGKLMPTLPTWLLDGKQPTSLAWFLKEKVLPPLYWHVMLKGHEWLATPKPIIS